MVEVAELGTTIEALIQVGYATFLGWSLAVIALTSILALWLNKHINDRMNDND